MDTYAVYDGSYNDFGAVGQVLGALHRWIGEHGYRIVDAAREYYLRPPLNAKNPHGIMEIQYPVEQLEA